MHVTSTVSHVGGCSTRAAIRQKTTCVGATSFPNMHIFPFIIVVTFLTSINAKSGRLGRSVNKRDAPPPDTCAYINDFYFIFYVAGKAHAYLPYFSGGTLTQLCLCENNIASEHLSCLVVYKSQLNCQLCYKTSSLLPDCKRLRG
jgi:hypothetical protein